MSGSGNRVYQLTRRWFLAIVSGAALAGGRARARPVGTSGAGYRFFTPEEARFVEAACNRLIPADAAGGGALDAGVPRYVDAQLAGDWGAGRRPFRDGRWQPGTTGELLARAERAPERTPAETFRAGLNSILASFRQDRRDFAAAPAAVQTRYLRRLQQGAVMLDGVSPTAFFEALLAMTVEGYFSHPRLGATRDRVAWRMRGFPGACARFLLAGATALSGIAAVHDVARAAAPLAVESDRGMVVSAQRVASEVGASILRDGGNAIDAAVAVGYALAVTHPCCGNIGGGGFMLLHLENGRDTFLNFRETAPQAATARMFLDARGNRVAARSLDGFLAAGVPGTVMGLETAREKYGTLPRATLLRPAIALAENGFTLTRGDTDVLDAGVEAFRREPDLAAVFTHRGAPLVPGDRLVQPDLAATLRLISAGGAEAFYRGPIAAAVAAASAGRGGILTAADFAAYTVTESAPVTCRYRGYTILSAPPPSSGGVILCEMLRILEGYPLRELGFHSSQSVHYLVEAMRFAYRDRNQYLGDPAFVDNPVGRLVSDAHAAAIRARIAPRRATPSASLPAAAGAAERPTTTHYSIVDRRGNAVSVTYTINDDFGAKVMAGGTGFLLNDEMDDFTAKPGAPNLFGLVQGTNNAIAPGKRPLSSMTPTIVLKDGTPVLVVGTPGGARIITTVLEILVNVIDHGMTLAEAVDAPRIHHQWLPDTLAAEPFALSADTTAALSRMGYRVEPLEVWSAGNAAQAVGIAPSDAAAAHALGFPRPGLLYGVSDSREPAGAAAVP